MQQLHEQAMESDYLLRDAAITHICKDVDKIHDMMKDLASLTEVQGVTLDNIDQNIESTNHNTDKGLSELRQANKAQRSYRSKLWKLAAGLAAATGITVVIGYLLH